MKPFVHQRVRKVRGGECYGAEGIVVSLLPTYNTGLRWDFSVHLLTTVTGADGEVFLAGTVVDAISDQWEPALPPEEETPEAEQPAPLETMTC